MSMPRADKTVALHRRESSIVPDDLGDRIRRRHVHPLPPSYEMHGHGSGDIPAHSRIEASRRSRQVQRVTPSEGFAVTARQDASARVHRG